MTFVRLLLIFTAIFITGGCTSITVRPVDFIPEMKHVCVADGRETCYDAKVITSIRDGFYRHGITTQVYIGNSMPNGCDYHLDFMCERSWDLATYMKHTEMRLYRNRDQIGYAEFHLNGGGGLSLYKFQDTKTKLDPVLDEFLAKYPVKKQDQ